MDYEYLITHNPFLYIMMFVISLAHLTTRFYLFQGGRNAQ